MLGISNICKGYKSFVMKWNLQHKHEGESKFIDSNNETSKEKEDFIISYPTTPIGGFNHQQSLDDSLLSRRSLSRNTSSRRSKTPTPSSFSRSMSRNTTPNSVSRSSSRRNPSESEILASISRNLNREAEISASISRNMSRNTSSSLSRNMSQNRSRRRPSDTEIPSPISASSAPASPTPTLVSPAASPSTSRSPNATIRTSASETDIPSTPLSRNTSKRSPTPIVFSQSTGKKKPAPPVEKKLAFTLEELCHGCVKKIKHTRDVINNGIIVQEEETLKINVQPGWRKGTRIAFEGKGDEKPGYLPADIIFLIDEKRHHLYKRVGRDDLEIAVEIPLVDALGGCSFPVPLLGGEKMKLSFDNIIYHGYVKVIEGQGMPKLKEPTKRGDLRITCLVNFPKILTDEQRSEAVTILADCSYEEQ